MRLFIMYINQRKGVILMCIVFFAVFIFSFDMYHLPWQAAAYPALLCAVFGIFVIIFDFMRVRIRHKILIGIQKRPFYMLDMLPESVDIEIRDYADIIRNLYDAQRKLENSMYDRYYDMVDYYTMWVHQIKTPIASMRLNLQNEDSQLSRKLSSDLFRIEQYVEMVLVFLRLDSESSDYVIREYDLDDIIKQAVRRFAGEFIGRKLSLKYEPVNTKILTDEKWFLFVIEQVLSNALKYTKSGGVAIYMEEAQILCIKDTGIGIAPGDLPRIFEKGYTGYNGRSDKRASGIGLYLSKQICSKLGHGISAESVLDSGTTVRIDLSRRELETE
ncbi:MAG: HAMP domain-containing histidine kinase [Firmicutes bacterium]|nr:HAMP domain-containing histidine kinase [Bacillota bacterium]